MADTIKNATCPVCGYREDATDATALQSAMEEHMQSAHNLSMSTMNVDADIKEEKDDRTDVEKIADTTVTHTGVSIAGFNNRVNQ